MVGGRSQRVDGVCAKLELQVVQAKSEKGQKTRKERYRSKVFPIASRVEAIAIRLEAMDERC